MDSDQQKNANSETNIDKTELCRGFNVALAEKESDGAELASHLAADAVAVRATDIHIDPALEGYRILLRIDGFLHPAAKINLEEGEALTRAIQVDANIDSSTGFDRNEGTSHLGPEGTPMRVASVRTIRGPKLSLRLLEVSQIHHDVRALGMNDSDEKELLRWANRGEGMVLCVGPTGCGKTTTCYALLNEMKNHGQRNILTLEDPVEFDIDGINQVQIDAADRRRPDNFSQGVKALLRHDPDALFLGEIRDQEAARSAIDASFSGHILLSTMHSRDAASAVTLLRSMAIKDYEIAASLRIVVGQRILRALCRKCRYQREPDDVERAELENHGIEMQSIWIADGCADCSGTGYSDLSAVFELWRMNDEDYQAIIAHKDENYLREQLRARGVRSLADAAAAKVCNGTASLSDAIGIC